MENESYMNSPWIDYLAVVQINEIFVLFSIILSHAMQLEVPWTYTCEFKFVPEPQTNPELLYLLFLDTHVVCPSLRVPRSETARKFLQHTRTRICSQYNTNSLLEHSKPFSDFSECRLQIKWLHYLVT